MSRDGRKKGPVADDDGRRGDFSRWDTNSPPNNQPAQPGQEPIQAEVNGSTICIAIGLKVDSPSPVLAMCRRLVAVGYDPATPLHCYRGDTLCLTARSIGEGADLQVNSDGTGFIARPEARSGPPVSLNERADGRCPGRLVSSLGEGAE